MNILLKSPHNAGNVIVWISVGVATVIVIELAVLLSSASLYHKYRKRVISTPNNTRYVHTQSIKGFIIYKNHFTFSVKNIEAEENVSYGVIMNRIDTRENEIQSELVYENIDHLQ